MQELNVPEVEQEVLEVQQGVQEVAQEVQQGVKEVAQEVQQWVKEVVQEVQQGVKEVQQMVKEVQQVQQEVPRIEPRVKVSLGPTKEQPGPRKIKTVNGKTLLRNQSYTLVNYTISVPANLHQNVHLQSLHAGMLPPGDPTFLCLSHLQPHTAGGCHLLKRQEISVPPYSTFRYSGHITCCLQFH